MNPSPVKVKKLHDRILGWYQQHRRALRWRVTTDPYEILVSEIMLQQTQVSRVQSKLPLFLKHFPTMQELAHSSKRDVIRAWQGMGYNNRAVRLWEMANQVVHSFGGRLPTDIESLMTLPGVGPYTAHALSCFAFRRRVPVVDVNIRRVLTRIFGEVNDSRYARHERAIWQTARKILPRDAYSWNQALMDLGATTCTAQKPACSSCPVETLCISRHLYNHHRKSLFPARTKRTEPSYRGIPQRIWRGRIIQMLRERSSVTLLKLGKSITPTCSSREFSWLAGIVQKLQTEGLVGTRNGRISLARK